MNLEKSKKSSKNGDLKAPNRQITAHSGKNESSTGTEIGTPLTQRCSWSDHRSALILKREAVGAETPAGLTISTLVEQLENKQTDVRPAWAQDHRQTLDYQIEKSLTRLSDAM